MKLEHVDPGDKKFRDWLRHYREEIDGEAPPDEWLDQYLKVLFREQGKARHIWWAMEGGRKIGFAVATLQRGMVDGRAQATIAEFYIYPEHRREGWGRRLSTAVIEFLKSQGAGDVYAAVVAGNVRGLRFWEACGFQIARYALVYRPEVRQQEEDEEEI